MKRVTMAVTALALMSGAAFAQAPGQPAQPADPEQAARKGTINQPMAGTTTGPTATQAAPAVQERKQDGAEPSKNPGNSGTK